MPLKNCQSCGGAIDALAETCPACGAAGPGKKKKELAAGLLVIGVIFFFLIASLLDDKPAPKAQASAPADARALAHALLLVKQEKKIIDATWGDDTRPTLLAGVVDDSTRRDGFAGYLCSLLTDAGIKGGVVHILSANDKARRELGRADCPGGR
ncbi:MAG: hypothetical protein OEZ10_08805 [Gammaproteobacteria bacterium]|nr:hypothetical protein [Gammaproteobacteria bacterium]